jgi:hypothetical protein
LSPEPIRSVEQRVDVVLRGVTDVAVELRAVEQLGVAFAGVDDRRGVALMASTPPQMSIIALICCSMNFIVLITC